MLRYVLTVLVMTFCLVLFAEERTPANDPTIFPASASIRLVQIPNYTFPMSQQTNCYILAGEHGEALIIDPCEQLDIIPEQALLVNKDSGVSSLVKAETLATYEVIARDTVRDPSTGHIRLVYDYFRPTGEYGVQLLELLEREKLTLKLIILTHGHLDHIGAAQFLKKKTGATLLLHAGDIRGADGAKLPELNDGIHGYPKDAYRIAGTPPVVDRIIQEGDLISLDGMVLQVLHTPGHSPGSICLRTQQDGKQILFSGDTLLHWRGGYDASGRFITVDTGRTNFLDGSGDEELLYRMVREKLFTLPDATIVFPGHDEATSIEIEKQYSPARHQQQDQDTSTSPTEKPVQ